MIVCNQGAVTDSITRSSKWPQANHISPSPPGYKPPLAWYAQSENLLPQRQKDSYGQWALAAWRCVNGLSITHYIQGRLFPFGLTQGCTLCLICRKKKKKKQHRTKFPFKRNPETKAEWMTNFFIKGVIRLKEQSCVKSPWPLLRLWPWIWIFFWCKECSQLLGSGLDLYRKFTTLSLQG